MHSFKNNDFPREIFTLPVDCWRRAIFVWVEFFPLLRLLPEVPAAAQPGNSFFFSRPIHFSRLFHVVPVWGDPSHISWHPPTTNTKESNTLATTLCCSRSSSAISRNCCCYSATVENVSKAYSFACIQQWMHPVYYYYYVLLTRFKTISTSGPLLYIYSGFFGAHLKKKESTLAVLVVVNTKLPVFIPKLFCIIFT